MSKEYLEALNGLFDLVHCQDSFEKAQKYFDIIEEALQRLESIDNANPSEALECLEYICKILNEKRIDVKWLFKHDYNTINKALLKAQTQEKEKLFFKNIHNTKVKTPLVSIFEGLSKDERFKFTEHIYYHWEEMKEALEDKNNELEKENVELKAKAQKEHNSVNLLMQELDCKDFADLRKYARCGYEKINKKYLKWGDLEFNPPKMIDVKMSGNKYKLELGCNIAGYNLAILRNNKQQYYFLEADKQFFNDLHLERVEE